MNKDQINRWKTLANKELKDKTIDSLNWLTPEDIIIKPLYTENDLENINHLNELRLFDKEYDNKLLRIEHFKESLEYLEYEALGKIKKLFSN